DCKSYFASVIKNVAFPSFAVKKLVYIYLLRYAEEEPDLSLLSINTFQKDLSDPNPMIRTVALRVLCSIKVPLILPISASLSSHMIVLNAFKKGASDLSPYVRKAVAFSLVKAYVLDPVQSQSSLVEIIEHLLNDKSSVVLGPVVDAWREICPTRLDLLHRHFKKCCSLMGESDEWAQVQLLDVLDVYCRGHFPDPLVCQELDKDHALFVESCRPLLFSRNSLVVLKVARIVWGLPRNDLKELAAQSLIRTLSRPKQEQHMLLVAIKELAIQDCRPWLKHLSSFAVFPSEMNEIKMLKLDIINVLAREDNMNWIVPELKYYSSCSDAFLALAAIKTWRAVVTRIPSIVQPTLEALISLLSNSNDAIVGEAIITIRHLLSTKSEGDLEISQKKLLTYLVSIYDTITVPMARASILWLIGHHLTSFQHAPDALRISIKSFATESSFVKKQLLTLSCLMRLHVEIDPARYPDESIRDFLEAAFHLCIRLAKLDVDFDVRDQARLLESFLAELDVAVYPRLFALLSQVAPVVSIPTAQESRYRVESLSHLLGQVQPGYTDEIPWADAVKNAEDRETKETDQTWNRDRVVVGQVKAVKKSTKIQKRVVNLDDFYADVASPSPRASQTQAVPDVAPQTTSLELAGGNGAASHAGTGEDSSSSGSFYDTSSGESEDESDSNGSNHQ
ncbi:AP-3 complex subunit beta-1, partial [Kappamyces sp. JEL0680]